jgi:phosphate starvation-inducible protein PhoH
MAKKRRSAKQFEIENLQMALSLNGQAMEEGRKRKHWSIQDLNSIKPLTPTQEDMFYAWANDMNICAHGTAGSGKTFIALYLALSEVLQQRQQQIIIVRSAVPSREIGFTPGDENEKMAVYEAPYHNIFYEHIGRPSTYQDMKDAGIVKFVSTSFIRGVTWDNAVIIFDEIQNANWEEINTVLTRVGHNSRIILCGDTKQDDLHYRKNDKSGISLLMDVVCQMSSFECMKFTHHDIVRSNFVKQWIIACENANI